METVLLNVKNVLVFIDDLLLHTATHEEHFRKVASKSLKSQSGRNVAQSQQKPQQCLQWFPLHLRLRSSHRHPQ
jgi:hypothetical protein